VAPEGLENFMHLYYEGQFMLVLKNNRKFWDLVKTGYYSLLKTFFT